jgi:hypothetical protein
MPPRETSHAGDPVRQGVLDFAPRARTGDPLSSHAAADALERSGRAWLIARREIGAQEVKWWPR